MRLVLRMLRGPATAVLLATTSIVLPGLVEQAVAQSSPAIDGNDIGGVVTGPKGPEAGVWVIAETRDLALRYIKIVVTDDQGRYVIPDLPKANYSVWVRGYGLVDSTKIKSEPGKTVNHTAVVAPDEKSAAQYYPGIYWYSMMTIPGQDQFGGKSDIPKKIDQARWLNIMKSNGCVGCHQLGQLATRTIPKLHLGKGSHEDGWINRIQSGQAGGSMVKLVGETLNGVPIKYFADWTQRIAKGEVPHARPPRPQGVERNIVVTLRDWMNEKQYLHDLIASDRRNPTVNAYGPLYGSPEYSSDNVPVLDPVKNSVTSIRLTTTPDTSEALGPGHAAGKEAVGPSAYWGNEKIWDTKANNHNSMLDSKGRVWMAATGNPGKNPAFCGKGSDLPSAKAVPLSKSNRRVTMYDPKTKTYSTYLTCFQTHHVQFGYDKNDTLWTSGGQDVVGWLNTKLLDETGDIKKAQGWAPFVLDTNGNGKLDGYTGFKDKADPAKDTRIKVKFYAVMPSPVDGSVWGTFRSYPGAAVRYDPATGLSELYNVPKPGFGPRGGDIDSKGVVWLSLASGHMGAFDRSKCKAPLNGPKATGNHCPEGWTLYKYPGPGFKGIGDNSAESSYYSWVDQHDTFGLGKDVPMSTGNLNDGLIAFRDGKMVVLRVPYPMGYYAKGFDGRIDDPKAGWKGRGLWTTNGDRAPWLIEGGKGSKPLAAHFQLRNSPLDK